MKKLEKEIYEAKKQFCSYLMKLQKKELHLFFVGCIVGYIMRLMEEFWLPIPIEGKHPIPIEKE